MPKAIFAGADFRKMVSAALRFPGVSGISDAGKINLKVSGGKAVATVSNLVVSYAYTTAQGELPLIAVDTGVISKFAGLCTDSGKVSVTVKDRDVELRTRSSVATVPLATGVEILVTAAEGSQKIPVTGALASSLKYLSQIAFGDPSRPELNCVMLVGGQAMACNQRGAVVLSLTVAKDRLPIPVNMAAALEDGDNIFLSKSDTILRHGKARYCMPVPSKAIKSYPVDAMKALVKHQGTVACTCKAVALKNVLAACRNVAVQSLIADLDLGDGKILVTSTNQMVRFSDSLAATVSTPIKLRLPLDEIISMVELASGELAIAVGKNGETLLHFTGGCCVLPRLKIK